MTDDAAITDDAAAMAAEASGGDPADAAMGDPADAAAAADDGSGLVAALFETEPDADPSTMDAPEPAAEAIVGVQKLVHGLGLDTGDGGDGTPAFVHFVRAALGFAAMRSADDAEAESDDTEADDESADGPTGPQVE